MRVVRFPELPPEVAEFAARQKTSSPNAASVRKTRSNAVDTVYELISNGVTQKGELIATSGYSESAVRAALNELRGRGLVSNPEHGRWELVS